MRQTATEIVEKAKTQQKAGKTKSRKALADLLKRFTNELSKVRALDPACGSGNFLYVALKRLHQAELSLGYTKIHSVTTLRRNQVSSAEIGGLTEK